MYLTKKDLEGLTPAQKSKAKRILKEQQKIANPFINARIERENAIEHELWDYLEIGKKVRTLNEEYYGQIRKIEEQIQELRKRNEELYDELREKEREVRSVVWEKSRTDAGLNAIRAKEREVREKCEATLKAYLDECHAQKEKVTA